ncbi:NAD-dependent epimerase/dehydratase family protein [Hydrogenophaga sp.]|uniref:NAD-dependent epimerase/dehydratase family protein n=1 Tax=Hydrogenophaga sp. TaxID=1904254 RepID=UPI00272FFCFF|nr:NAD-dependent epimerase/dehydratase family protein [Hydrogenophaga sp.]MDP1685039.1 NAD-dependent epimerase/dehydratase family protein [Hydrogenophaga sp.]
MDHPLKTHHRLLLTGAAGGLGTALRERLKGNCEVLRLSDKAGLGEAQAGEEIVLADLSNADEVNAMVAGVDAIVHMGGISVGQVMRTIAPFYGALGVCLLLVTYVPAFSLWLPGLVK